VTPCRIRPQSRSARLLALLWLVVGLSSLGLGPLLAPLERAVAESQHVCACGMAPGTCGCPECERVERERLSTRARHPYPVLRGDCDHDSTLLGDAHPLPALLPAALAVRLPEPSELAPSHAPPALRSLGPPAPPKPPPRPSLTIA
jgi:hypothetical protein